jgi:folate-binding protein YgfZ
VEPRSPEPAPAAPAGPGTTTLIRLEGRDVLTVLHRISTQALSDLAPGRTRVTLFCDFRGRLLHRAAVAVTGSQVTWLLRDDAPPEGLSAYIDRHVFREDVRITPAPAAVSVVSVEGGFGRPPESLAVRDGMPAELQLSNDFGLAVENRLEARIGPDSASSSAAGGSSGSTSAAPGERARIHAGRPRHGHEIEPSFNPFEVGLAHEVHLSKGCFTGQEALMRMVTYGGVRRRLVRLEGSGPVPAVPGEIRSGGIVVGRLTSAAENDAGWIGLAVLKHDALDSGTSLEVEGGGAISSRFVFPEARPLGLP